MTHDDKVDLQKPVDSDEKADLEEGVTDTDADRTVAVEVAEDAAPDTAATDQDVDDTVVATPPPSSQRITSAGGRPVRLLVPIALVIAFVLSAGAAAVTYFALYRADEKVDEVVAAQVIQSASDGAVALLSYTPETLDKDFATAKSLLTGDFLNYYTQFTQEIVTPAAKQKQVKTSAAVVRSALSKLEPTSAEILLFINQATVSKENPDGSFTASSVKVEMTKVGDGWLISSFDPV